MACKGKNLKNPIQTQTYHDTRNDTQFQASRLLYNRETETERESGRKRERKRESERVR